jgi:FKBP-type peptidyl-prolyl cis-trans isomerase
MKSKLLIGKVFTVALMLTLSSCIGDEVENPYAQLSKDIKKIDDYLATNGNPDAIYTIKDATGIRMEILELGTGVPPNAGNNLKIDYVGKLFSDGSIFDQKDNYLDIKLSSSIINGWKIALSMMNKGTHAIVYIPSGLAYGTKGREGGAPFNVNIPKNAILVFDIFLEEVSNTTAQNAQLTADIAAIDFQLEEDNITAIEDPSGVRIQHTQIGTGSSPGIYSQVKIKFSANVLGGGVIFGTTESGPSDNFSSRVVNYLHGLVVGLPQMQEGGTAKFYIPSTLGYGALTFPNIPANSNLIITVELVEVIN